MVNPVALVKRSSTAAVRCCVEEVKETKVAVLEIWRWARRHDWKQTAKTCFRRKYWGWWFALALTTALSAVLSSYHHQIITAIAPYKHSIREAKWSWIVPVVVLVIVSFPPLFGHELIILAVGIVWNLGVGFVIACAGTFLGEVACFYAFRYFLTERAHKIEQKHLAYSCLARMMRSGGVGIIILVRFSAIPGHVTTAIQSTVGMSIWIYSVAAAFSLPKQFALLYIGHIFGTVGLTLEEWRAKNDPSTPLSEYYSGSSTVGKRHRISLIVFAATTLATLIALWIVWMRIRKIRPIVMAEMEARRQAEELENGGGSAGESKDDLTLAEDAVIPVTGGGGARRSGEGRRDSVPMRNVTSAGLENGNVGGDRLGPTASTKKRPTFIAMNSSSSLFGSTAALLGPGGGRSRSGTNATVSSLNSPSLPHLPLASDADYFSLERGEGDDGENGGASTPSIFVRRGSVP
ncbi:hypothetical protein T439DRAFT_320226 [Meredithblackwellia eburnea MCA 4105]